ncbi:MAG: PadR family transcriptional regulator [Acidobacteriia bacterium]|nr:PadR family transcriptional regulator [Terriglobia bacterium]
MALPKSEVMYGTLDLLVLKTLEALGPLHGYAIAGRIHQVSCELLRLNQGTLYPALLRLEHNGWISSKWGTTENNRKARYYSITRSGRKRLIEEAGNWEQMAEIINRVLAGSF